MSDAHARTDAMGPGLLESAWRYRWSVLLVVVVFGAAGYGLSDVQPRVYEASAEMVLLDPRSSNVFSEGWLSPEDLTRRTSKQAELAVSSRVLSRAQEELEDDVSDVSLEFLRGSVAAVPEPELDLVRITARSTEPELAASLANAVTEAYRATIREDGQARVERSRQALEETQLQLEEAIRRAQQRLDRDPDDEGAAAELDAAASQLVALQTRASEMAVNAAMFGDGLEFVEPAVAPLAPSSPRPRRNGVAAALLGFLVASGLAWIRADRNRTVEDPADPEILLDAPLLGEIPEVVGRNDRAELAKPQTMPSMHYDFVAVNLEHNTPLGGVILLTSAQAGDGKTVSAINIAAALARGGLRVVLVDGDARIKGLTRLLGVKEAHPGLTDFVRGRRHPAECRVPISLGGGSELTFVPSGAAIEDLAHLYRSPAMGAAMTELREKFDVVLVDSPPILAVSDTASLANNAACVVLVVRQGTSASQIVRARHHLSMTNTPIAGYIFARSRSASHRDPYGGRYSAALQHRSTVEPPTASSDHGGPLAATPPARPPSSAASPREPSRAPIAREEPVQRSSRQRF